MASKISGLLTACLLLNGCLNDARFSSLEPTGTARSESDSSLRTAPAQSVANPSFYLVKPGDTLYSIAFRFGLDYKKLARANGIGPDYRIYEEQSLALKEVGSSPSKSNAAPVTTAEPSVTVSVRSDAKADSQNTGVQSIDKTDGDTDVTSWIWPHGGKIVRTYKANTSTRKGIDLRGRIGDSVLAATNGVVVYAGNGLPGYGNLIILEHGGSLLSAYAFTENMLVKEKDRVRSGQQIATMGAQGDQPGLHFEIRRNGKPVDPLTYLPKR